MSVQVHRIQLKCDGLVAAYPCMDHFEWPGEYEELMATAARHGWTEINREVHYCPDCSQARREGRVR